MQNDNVKFRRAKETSFLIVDEIVFDKLSPYALKVYGQLRKLTSFKREVDETEITVKNLALSSGISERKVYDVLNELEFEHYLIQRSNIYNFKFGKTNIFSVSQTYGFFKSEQKINPAPHSDPVDNFAQNLSPTAPRAEGTAPRAEGTAQYADLYKQESLQEVFKKKQKQGNSVKPPVSVFSDKQIVKTHIEQIVANREIFLEEEIVDQGIYYAFETNKDKSFESVNKRINIFLKKVREGKWLIPQGYNGITSQSLRDKEERDHVEKQKQYMEEAQAAKQVFAAVATGEGFKGFQEAFRKLKGEFYGNAANAAPMSAIAV